MRGRLALIANLCLVALLLIPQPQRTHAQIITPNPCPVYPLNPPLVPDGTVLDYQVDAEAILYRAIQEAPGTAELYALNFIGAAAVKLNPPLAAGGDVQPDYTAHNRYVTFRADADYDDVIELFSVHLGENGFAPGDPVRLHPPFNPDSGANVLDYLVYRDRVIFRADFEQDETAELYSVPVAGGELTKLNAPLVGGGDVSPGYVIAEERVVYIADQAVNNTWELYSVPVTGGTATQISADVSPESEVLDFVVSGDRLLYRVRQGSDGPVALFGTSVTDGGATLLSPELPAGQMVFPDYHIDGDLALFRAGTEGATTLYSNLIVGGAMVTLNQGGTVPDYGIGNGRVVYRADQDTPGVWELFAARVSGGDHRKLNGPLVPGGNVLDYRISGDQIIYRADQEIDEVNMVYSVFIRAGDPVRLNPDLVPGADITEQYAVRGGRVIYLADQESPQDFALYSVPILGGEATRLNAPLPPSGDVQAFDFAAFSVIYRADQEVNNRAELYSVPLAGGGLRRLNTPITGGEIVDYTVNDGLVAYRANDGAGVITLYGTTLDCSAPVAPDPTVEEFLPRLDITTSTTAERIAWTFDLRNAGRIPGFDVTLTTTLPAVLQINAVETTTGELTLDGQKVSVTVAQFNPGAELRLTVETTASTGTVEVIACTEAVATAQSCVSSGAVTIP